MAYAACAHGGAPFVARRGHGDPIARMIWSMPLAELLLGREFGLCMMRVAEGAVLIIE